MQTRKVFTQFSKTPCSFPMNNTPNSATTPVLIAVSTCTYRHKSTYFLLKEHPLPVIRRHHFGIMSLRCLSITNYIHILSWYTFTTHLITTRWLPATVKFRHFLCVLMHQGLRSPQKRAEKPHKCEISWHSHMEFHVTTFSLSLKLFPIFLCTYQIIR